MKKMVSVLIAMVMVFTFLNVTSAVASGEYYYGSMTGVVICTNVSIREQPKTSAKRYGQLHNGDVVSVISESGGWVTIDLSSTGIKGVSSGVGYAKSSLIKISPYWIVLSKYTYVYADPWRTGKSNGELEKGTPLLVISENSEYYCCRLKSGYAGVTFVKKEDVGPFTSDYGYPSAVVVDGPINVYDGGWKVIGTLKTLDIVQVTSWGGEYSSILLSDGYTGWVETININPIIN